MSAVHPYWTEGKQMKRQRKERRRWSEIVANADGAEGQMGTRGNAGGKGEEKDGTI